MKASKIAFTWEEVFSMRLERGRGVFSLTRFKRVFREKARKLIAKQYRDALGSDGSAVQIEVGRVALREINVDRPGNFLVDVSYLSGGRVFCRETFRYIFENPERSLNGSLVPRKRRYAKW
ncbi:MAG: hypothetical protein IPJ68_03355 [Candidatus Moraniibacteriota bacterium]|nr:MAG: hypothetical protein IPJ68_03355 [Candidatus Moranbacteria bacterium]